MRTGVRATLLVPSIFSGAAGLNTFRAAVSPFSFLVFLTVCLRMCCRFRCRSCARIG